MDKESLFDLNALEDNFLPDKSPSEIMKPKKTLVERMKDIASESKAAVEKRERSFGHDDERSLRLAIIGLVDDLGNLITNAAVKDLKTVSVNDVNICLNKLREAVGIEITDSTDKPKPLKKPEGPKTAFFDDLASISD
jgi:hypothetical protein